MKVLEIFGKTGTVLRRLSEAPLFAGVASAATATGTTFIELCRTGTPEAVAAALRSGADVNARGEKKRTALMCAAVENPNPEVVAVLLEAGANVHERNRSGRTALMEARKNESPRARKAIVQLLKGAEEQPFYGNRYEKGR